MYDQQLIDHIQGVSQQVDKMNYDKNYYSGNELVMAIQGKDGKWYSLETAANYDKNYFTGTISERPKNTIVGEAVMVPKTPGFPAMEMPAIPGGGSGGAGMPPANLIDPIKRIPTDGELGQCDQFDLTVTKTRVAGVLINVNLPFWLFAPVFFDTNYQSLLLDSVPTGLTMTVIELGTSNVRFLFNDGGGNQTAIDVSSTTTPYRSILSALRTARFNVIKVREQIGDTVTISQVSLPFKVSKGSLFGGQSFNPISGVAQKGPNQFQNGIIDFDAIIPMNEYRAIQSFIAGSAPDAFTTTYSFWATDFHAH